MNSVYESLRTLLRNKELEIKKLEKEIEALRIVLPIVAEAGDVAPDHPTFDAPRATAEPPKPKALTGADFENVMSQVRAVPPSAPAAGARPGSAVAADSSSKGRTTWP